MINGNTLLYVIFAIVFATLAIKIINKYDYVPKQIEPEEILIKHPVHGLFLCVECELVHNNKFQCPNCLNTVHMTLPKLLKSEVDFKELVRIKDEKAKEIQITEKDEDRGQICLCS